jgi:hypothetical protein
MANAIPLEYEAVLGMVRSWPPSRRLALVQHVLRTLDVEAQAQASDVEEPDAFGLLADVGATLSDDDPARVLSDERMRNSVSA